MGITKRSKVIFATLSAILIFCMVALIAALGKFISFFFNIFVYPAHYSSWSSRLDIDRELCDPEADGDSGVAGPGQGQDGAAGGQLHRGRASGGGEEREEKKKCDTVRIEQLCMH